ncbi:DUF2283 domain-containing protein [Thiothrix fructosivorans]|uniref:DUF2283 domain-containing protein n=1 Tax=Thiothrix fructosivorans TaxID=111770 RepID=A0A8B0SGZ1_9GAMM|nr:DUF2283 domain-containing protein [Thiothrix fructosivorans]MBO0615361.1 DUF2283 domain-containing protein [Thiothrix fructosivorans]QTX10135.1 DUF2283 domain-containing protein [Thiothrix fructosivorans]
MKAIYHQDDDILVLRFSDELPAREVSQGWNVNISYTARGDIVEIVVLEAKESGLYPVFTEYQQAA